MAVDEIAKAKQELVCYMRAIADGIEGGTINPKGFTQVHDAVKMSHGKMVASIPVGKNQFLVTFEKPL